MNKIWTWFKGRLTAYSNVFWPEMPKKKHDYEYNGNNVLPDPYNKILEEWKTIWTGKNEFKPFLEKEYKTICASAKKHQDYNFWSKRRFIVHLRWVSGLQILYIVFLLGVSTSPIWIYLINRCFGTKHLLRRLLDILPLNAGLIAGIEAVFLLSIIIISIVNNKWIVVKKYQETWARKALLRHNLSDEMLKYIYALEPYDEVVKQKRDKLFMLNVLAILDQNIEKFVQNMEEKEHGLIDDILSLKASAKSDAKDE